MLYKSVRLTPAKQREILSDVKADAEERTAVVLRDIAGHRRALQSLEAQQAHLVELSFRGLVSDAVLARKQQELEVEQARVRDLLAKAQQHADDIEADLAEILDRTKTQKDRRTAQEAPTAAQGAESSNPGPLLRTRV